MITIWGHSMDAQIGGGPHAPGMWLTGTSQRLLEQGGDGVLGNDLRACNAYTDGMESAGQVKCPALLIVGGLDMMTPPRVAKKLLGALSDAKQIMVRASGHMLMAEQPDAVLDALIDFHREQTAAA